MIGVDQIVSAVVGALAERRVGLFRALAGLIGWLTFVTALLQYERPSSLVVALVRQFGFEIERNLNELRGWLFDLDALHALSKTLWAVVVVVGVTAAWLSLYFVRHGGPSLIGSFLRIGLFLWPTIALLSELGEIDALRIGAFVLAAALVGWICGLELLPYEAGKWHGLYLGAFGAVLPLLLVLGATVLGVFRVLTAFPPARPKEPVTVDVLSLPEEAPRRQALRFDETPFGEIPRAAWTSHPRRIRGNGKSDRSF